MSTLEIHFIRTYLRKRKAESDSLSLSTHLTTNFSPFIKKLLETES